MVQSQSEKQSLVPQIDSLSLNCNVALIGSDLVGIESEGRVGKLFESPASFVIEIFIVARTAA